MSRETPKNPALKDREEVPHKQAGNPTPGEVAKEQAAAGAAAAPQPSSGTSTVANPASRPAATTASNFKPAAASSVQPVAADSDDGKVGVAGLVFDAIAAAVAIAFSVLLLQDSLPFLQ